MDTVHFASSLSYKIAFRYKTSSFGVPCMPHQTAGQKRVTVYEWNKYLTEKLLVAMTCCYSNQTGPEASHYLHPVKGQGSVTQLQKED